MARRSYPHEACVTSALSEANLGVEGLDFECTEAGHLYR